MKEDQIAVEEIVRQYLIEHGYDGLYSDVLECGCSLDDLMPCEGSPFKCVPGYRVEDPTGECDFVTVPEKEAK